MQIIQLIFFGFLAGVIGGMGMGGGTLLVPLLSFVDLPQKTVQAINLISFLPMCAVALCFHAKNNLVQTKDMGWITIPAVAFAVLGAIVAGGATNTVLRYVFGSFLIAVGVWQLVVAVRFEIRQKQSLVVAVCPNGVLTAKRQRRHPKYRLRKVRLSK